MKKKIVLAIFISFYLIACNNSKNKKTSLDSKPSIASNNEALAKGFKLLENSCFSCHSPNPSINNSIAPTLLEIKEHYIAENTSQERFKKDFVTFINKPTKENAKIPGAIDRFGFMPKMNFNEEDLNRIAEYIFNTELEKPRWFEKHYQKEKVKFDSLSNFNNSPLEYYKSIAMKTKSVLGKNLIQAINTKGTENALSFCSEKAIFLTDSVARSLNMRVKRVSDKNRNPDNKANADELAYILNVKEAISKQQTVKPKLKNIEGREQAYFPIITNKMCLQCHGKPGQEIAEGALAKINHLYPNDLATGYESGELRGIWVIEKDSE